MIYIGSHLSVSAGYAAMAEKMKDDYRGDTYAFFLRNPRGGKMKVPEQKDLERMQEIRKEGNFGPMVAHAPYTMNPCSAREDIRELAAQMMAGDLEQMERMAALAPDEPIFYNFHPGSHTGQGVEKGIRETAEILNRVITRDQKTTVLLETMAGKGSEIGKTFEELREILDLADEEKRVHLGVCFDTCHTWDGGYDVQNDLDGVLQHFDDVIGLDRLKAVHLNDSKNDRGAARDRHEKLGEGMIGLEALRRVVLHPALQGKPFILETPNEDAGYRKEIALVRKWIGKDPAEDQGSEPEAEEVSQRKSAAGSRKGV